MYLICPYKRTSFWLRLGRQVNQHLHRWLGGNYFTYYTGLAENDLDWKLELHLLCEETDPRKRKALESLFINRSRPVLQDPAGGRFQLYPHYGYPFNDVTITPFVQSGETEPQRRVAFKYRVEQILGTFPE